MHQPDGGAQRRTAQHPALDALPSGWRLVESSGPGPFTTHATLVDPAGSTVSWTSRGHRKGHLLALGSHRRSRAQRMAWAMGLAFMVGSACFALGSVPAYFDTIDPSVVAWTFFVGSLFFTGASYLQFHEVQRAPASIDPDGPLPEGVRSYLGWKPRRIDWWATAVQLVGTVFFNITTFAATRSDLSAAQARHLIWGPDVAGSICFLIASWLAYSEVNRGVLPRSDRSVGWRIGTINMVGSIAFGISAIAARYVGTTSDVANLSLVNLGTFTGAVCFFAGAALLPVEASRST